MLTRAAKSPAGLYGDADKGSVVFDGSTTILGIVPSSNVYTLTANIHVNNMTVNNGVTIIPNGFIPFVNGTLNNAGVIQANGINAVGLTAGAAISATGVLQTVSGAGGAGRNINGAGGNATGSGGRNVPGSAGASGGQADPGNLGGTGNNSAAPTAIQGGVRSLAAVLRGRLYDNTSFNGSGGGGGGGCNVGTGTATSGGGGSAAVVLVIFCRRLNNTGTICANGGNGADAVATGNGKAGGGGPGGGGCVFIVTDQIVAQGTIQVNAGTPGNGIGGGSNGATGTAGYGVIFTPTTQVLI